ncbi:Uncharacterized protein APZ42_005808 [Daphnia magna]|uniref:Uncharacterized protein n=1 Tax=Daphnia magna TaxID=35525 RepID=A0A164G8U9_9CRUS|nr:Uncharacterized protein APZ42_005808 [Daphnia magna]
MQITMHFATSSEPTGIVSVYRSNLLNPFPFTYFNHNITLKCRDQDSNLGYYGYTLLDHTT